jgi:hypothetical protein
MIPALGYAECRIFNAILSTFKLFVLPSVFIPNVVRPFNLIFFIITTGTHLLNFYSIWEHKIEGKDSVSWPPSTN